MNEMSKHRVIVAFLYGVLFPNKNCEIGEIIWKDGKSQILDVQEGDSTVKLCSSSCRL